MRGETLPVWRDVDLRPDRSLARFAWHSLLIYVEPLRHVTGGAVDFGRCAAWGADVVSGSGAGGHRSSMCRCCRRRVRGIEPPTVSLGDAPRCMEAGSESSGGS